MSTVSALAFTPVKGTRLLSARRVELGKAGVAEDRRFFVIDAHDRMVNGKQFGALQAVVARYEPDRRLTLTFPDGEVAAGQVLHGAEAKVRFFSRERVVRTLEGPWAAALSRHLGQPVRLAEAAAEGTAVDRGVDGAVSLISRGSLRRLAEIAQEPEIDARRFRMLVEVDGIEPNQEDGWVGRVVRLGPARVRMRGHVGRCLVTTRDPEGGEVDLPTLDFLSWYRHDAGTTEPLALGVYGEVLTPGAVAVGDPVAVEPD